MVGSLVFAQLDGASATADIMVGGAVLRIDFIDVIDVTEFNVDTTVQPM